MVAPRVELRVVVVPLVVPQAASAQHQQQARLPGPHLEAVIGSSLYSEKFPREPVAVGPAKVVMVKVMMMAAAAEAEAAAMSIPEVQQKSPQDSQSHQEAAFRLH